MKDDKNLPRYDNEGLISYYFETEIIILELMESGVWGKFEEEGNFPKSQIAIKIEGMKLPKEIKEGDTIKVIIKYERKKRWQGGYSA